MFFAVGCQRVISESGLEYRRTCPKACPPNPEWFYPWCEVSCWFQSAHLSPQGQVQQTDINKLVVSVKELQSVLPG